VEPSFGTRRYYNDAVFSVRAPESQARNNYQILTEAILFEICRRTYVAVILKRCKADICTGKGKIAGCSAAAPARATTCISLSACDSRDLYQCSLHVNSKKVTVDTQDCAFGFSLSSSSFGFVGVLWQFGV
jgi:hypothetical protein